jgi:hypothetical protein
VSIAHEKNQKYMLLWEGFRERVLGFRAQECMVQSFKFVGVSKAEPWTLNPKS